ncbi:hypothetical protein IC229_09150 [Spirosoma sp. BT702]|uniref:Tail specific protease domain-containing protein n=1 Tax=Spirosoma profusum TaxID=2771354 RepID=A0A926XZN1_9BACT|nr:S41 family peptidase [Spirosoma profusum]MBD2700803.1 hypothetical protein [Spirosoma profusum]
MNTSVRFAVTILRGLIVTLLFSAVLSAQTTSYTPAQIERVAKLSELYGHIKFFHPYLGYKPINWDSAFAAAAPLVAQAKTDEETIAAIRQLLAVLNDDVTTVSLKTKPVSSTATGDTIQVSFDSDSTLVLKMNGYGGVADIEPFIDKLGYFASQLSKARSLRLDLRSARPLSEMELEGFRFVLDYVGLARVLSTEPYATPGMRRRQHSGFATEGGGTSEYWSGFYLRSGQSIQPRASAKNRPVTLLINKNAALPPALYALKNRPHVTLKSDDTLTDAQLASTVTFSFSENIQVKFRTGELVNPDGTLGVKSLPAPLPVAPPPTKYAADKYPTLGNRLLAGAKIWSVINYFFAYKGLMPTDWKVNLRTAVGQLAAAQDSTTYAIAVAKFYRNIQDSHGFINATPLRYYAGAGSSLIDIRFIENKPVITQVWTDSVRSKGIQIGDVLTEVNGETITERIARMAAIQPASNEWVRQRELSWRLIRGPVGKPIRLKLLGADGREKNVLITAQPANELRLPNDTSAVYKLLPGNIGYAHMGRLQTKDVAGMFEKFKNTKAIIFDMRNYPQGTAWTIAPYLTDKRNVVAAQFFRYAPNAPDILAGDSENATQKYFFSQQIPPNTGQPVYKGKTVMLIDERTQSQAEHSGLFFEAANGTEFIGSPTAGANGDVTSFQIPGGIGLTFSGHDVRHADGRQLQQVGLQPKILVRPTIKGVRAGKDEVLDRAMQYLQTGK